LIEIRIANDKEYEQVRDFYYLLIDAMRDQEYKPGWKRDVYPTQDFLIGSIKNKELFVGEYNGNIVSCMVVNQEYNDGYKKIQWSVDAKDSEIFVIHALGVLPSFSGRGIAKQMVRKVIEVAQGNSIKAIRLDVLKENTPAERAYTKMGFAYIDTIQMFYEDTGWTDYRIFEYIV